VRGIFEWLERSVSTGFACWPYFLRDPSLASLRDLSEFELLISALQAKYPDHLWEFLQRQGFMNSPVELYGEMELLRLLDQFFDRASGQWRRSPC
jgi:hypothetical protein